MDHICDHDTEHSQPSPPSKHLKRFEFDRRHKLPNILEAVLHLREKFEVICYSLSPLFDRLMDYPINLQLTVLE